MEAIHSLKDYELGSIGMWPQFSSTSRRRNVAENDFAHEGELEGERVKILFKLFLTNLNAPNSHINCTG